MPLTGIPGATCTGKSTASLDDVFRRPLVTIFVNEGGDDLNHLTLVIVNLVFREFTASELGNHHLEIRDDRRTLPDREDFRQRDIMIAGLGPERRA